MSDTLRAYQLISENLDRFRRSKVKTFYGDRFEFYFFDGVWKKFTDLTTIIQKISGDPNLRPSPSLISRYLKSEEKKIEIIEFDVNYNILAFNDMCYNKKTKQEWIRTSEDYITKVIPYNFSEIKNSSTDFIEEYLYDFFTERKKINSMIVRDFDKTKVKVEIFKSLFKSCFDPGKCHVNFFGFEGNGKSSFARMIKLAIGNFVCVLDNEEYIEKYIQKESVWEEDKTFIFTDYQIDSDNDFIECGIHFEWFNKNQEMDKTVKEIKPEFSEEVGAMIPSLFKYVLDI